MIGKLVVLGCGLLCIWIGARANFTAYRKGYVMISRTMGSGGSKLYRKDHPRLFWVNIYCNFGIIALGTAVVVLMIAGLAGLKTI